MLLNFQEADSDTMYCTCGGIGDPFAIIMNKVTADAEQNILAFEGAKCPAQITLSVRQIYHTWLAVQPIAPRKTCSALVDCEIARK